MQILRINQVIEKTGLARSTIYKMIDANSFPKPIPLMKRAVGWLDSEIEEWIAERIAARDQ